jgi:diguanylate cyclase (GGDEF)-like protein/PAS domain S-box-containing protein
MMMVIVRGEATSKQKDQMIPNASSSNQTGAATSGPASLLARILETQSDLAAVQLDPPLVMQMVADRTQKLTGADGAAVKLIEGDVLVSHAGTGIMRSLDGSKLSLTASLAGYAIRCGNAVCSDDVENDPRAALTLLREIGVRSLMAVPLFSGEQPLGAIVVVSCRTAAFDESLVSAVRLMAGLVAASLSHASEFQVKKKLLTERTDALAALRQSEKRFHSAFEHAAIGMALVGTDGRWLQVNKAICRIVGYTEVELLVRDFQSITQPDDLNADLTFVRQLLAGEISDYQMVKRYIHRQGHLVWVLLSVSLVRDDDGEPLHFISQIQDITQRQRAQEELRASEDEYRAIFELAGVGKAQIDLVAGRFIRVNRKFCEITGYSADELLCMPITQFTHPDDLPACTAIVDGMLSGEICDQSLEKRYIHKSGRIVWVAINAAVLISGSRPARAVATFLDITERRLAERLEADRRHVLEMVAKDLPLPEVLGRLAETAERQIDGCLAAIMAIHDGAVLLHGPNLPDQWREELNSRCFTMAARLAATAGSSTEPYGVTSLKTDDVWRELRPAACKEGLETCWAVAIRASDEIALGLLVVFMRESRSPRQAEAQMLTLAGRLATIAIEHHQMTGQLAHLVRHDPLTGLPNRLMFDDRMRLAVAVARRTGKSVGIMVLDIDKFKDINDTLGHHAGDELLQQFAQRLSSGLRETDTMARIGGDEFVVILPELERQESAAVVARKFMEAMAVPFPVGIQLINVTISMGLALFPQDGADAVTVQKRADTAMYGVKARGRNDFSF